MIRWGLAKKKQRKIKLDLEIKDIQATIAGLGRYALGNSDAGLQLRTIMLNRQTERYKLVQELKPHMT